MISLDFFLHIYYLFIAPYRVIFKNRILFQKYYIILIFGLRNEFFVLIPLFFYYIKEKWNGMKLIFFIILTLLVLKKNK